MIDSSTQTTAGISIELENGIELFGSYCPRSNLPLLTVTSDVAPRAFWSDAFAYTAQDQTNYNDILDTANTNLSAAQKETLLWHQRLSHASISWIQLLMRDRRWLQTNVKSYALHQGPFIPCKEPRGPTCDISGLKCAACLTAKAHVRSSKPRRYTNRAVSKFTKRIEGGHRRMDLKRGDLHRGDCISTDHYISAIPGRLPNTYGRERQGYSCGTLFVDHASGKIFNYCQTSTSAQETIKSKHRLEALAKNEGFTIKSYHSDNGTFASDAYKSDCEAQNQQYKSITTSGTRDLAILHITRLSWA